MARVVVGAAGYLGDVAPYIPIAGELVRRGHDVIFLTPAGFHPLLAAERFDVATYPLELSPAGMREDPRHERLMRRPLLHTAGIAQYLMDKGFTDDPHRAQDAIAATLQGADVVVTHPAFATVMQPVAESMGVPVVLGHLFPMLLPTAAWTPAMPARQYRLGPLNRPMWAMASTIAQYAFRGKTVDRMRRDLGVGEVDMMHLAEHVDATVMLLSRQYCEDVAPDWPPMTWAGFSIWEGPTGDELPPDLEEFLDDGDPPVLVTLGTSAALNAGEQFATIARGLDALGVRSVILAGGPENLGNLAGRQGVVEFASTTKLLPRCRAAVVSGALGGVAATLRAGIPMVVHPQLVDQHWHGRRVRDLGAGVVAHRAGSVAGAVARIISDTTYADRARSMATALAEENGATIASDVVERFVQPAEDQ